MDQESINWDLSLLQPAQTGIAYLPEQLRMREANEMAVGETGWSIPQCLIRGEDNSCWIHPVAPIFQDRDMHTPIYLIRDEAGFVVDWSVLRMQFPRHPGISEQNPPRGCLPVLRFSCEKPANLTPPPLEMIFDYVEQEG
jgi:hypothetical protein